MKVAIVGHWAISRADADVIAFAVLECVQNPDVEEIFFAGIDGVGANALCFAILGRDAGRTTPKLTVVFPGRRGERPPWLARTPSPEEWSQQADEVRELENPMPEYGRWYDSLHCCSEYIIEQVAECGQVLVFWDGNPLATEVSRLVRKIQTQFIPWQHIEISGEEDQ